MAGPFKRRAKWSKRPVVRSPVAKFKNALMRLKQSKGVRTRGSTPGQPTPAKVTRSRSRRIWR